ncbi:Peptide chain release factor RF2 [Frankliniella fusca]|uniref:Peptide chain release factor RF2 n=1 Tax=Frankliniella fusca TaxID=407009 RepID=A0AAE1LPW6_9NEOP|nr:Peptide chain release factor RF2 [Frankliniella fusca]
MLKKSNQDFKQNVLTEKGYSKTFINKIFHIKTSNAEEFCQTCTSYINRKQVSKLCLCNGLEFPVVDCEIAILNRIEERLLAPRHIFQTIWTVNGGSGQFKTKGGIVNVPVDIDTTVTQIPRSLSDSNMIHVRLAKEMEYVNNYVPRIVRPRLLYDAIKKFVLKPLPKEEGIILSHDWTIPENSFTESESLEDNIQGSIFETLLTNDNVNFTGMSEYGIRMVPAEGFKPTSVLFDECCEFLAFPTIF